MMIYQLVTSGQDICIIFQLPSKVHPAMVARYPDTPTMTADPVLVPIATYLRNLKLIKHIIYINRK